MKVKPGTFRPFKSKVSILYVVLALLGPLLILAGAVIMAMVSREKGYEEISISLAVHLLWILPLFFLAVAMLSYPAITVMEDQAVVRTILKHKQIPLKEVSAFTVVRKFRQGNALILEMRNGERLKIMEWRYRNYGELKQALTAGIKMNPALKAAMAEEQAKHFLLWAGLLFGVSLLFLLYIQLRLGALPLEARKLEHLRVVLAEKPILLQEEENGDTAPVRLVLKAREYPGIEFHLKGAALWPARGVQLEPGDGLALLADKRDYYYAIVRKAHPFIRLKAIDIYAINRGNQAILALEDYNVALKAHLEYLSKQSLLALAAAGLLFGCMVWK